MSQLMKCPDCGNGDDLSTIEKLEGFAECDSIEKDGPQWNGTTNVLFDSSETVGVLCGCGWDYVGEDWMKALAS